MNHPAAAVSVSHLSKTFGQNCAVTDVSFSICSAEIVALVGCNGSGKSTLLKLLYGTLLPDAGSFGIDGIALDPGDPRNSRRNGMEMVFQDKDPESKLCPDMTVLENLFLGREILNRLGFVRVGEMKRRVKEILTHYKLSLPPLESSFAALSGGQQKSVSIARALLSRPRVLLLDEPTASLGISEREPVLAALRELKSQGVAIVLCSHALGEVMEAADRVLALRSGKLIADVSRPSLSEEQLAVLMSK